MTTNKHAAILRANFSIDLSGAAVDDSNLPQCFARTHKCVIGERGITSTKREGDLSTPTGSWAISEVLYRQDRTRSLNTVLPQRAIEASWGWCDDPKSEHYNRLIDLNDLRPTTNAEDVGKDPYPSHERLSREDELYDIIAVLEYNSDPPIAHLGSAIFMHVASLHGKPTKGCIGVEHTLLRKLIEHSCPSTLVCVR